MGTGVSSMSSSPKLNNLIDILYYNTTRFVNQVFFKIFYIIFNSTVKSIYITAFIKFFDINM